MDEMKRDDSFLKGEYLKSLFPIMFSVLGGTINALIDTLFVSAKLGSDGIAAVNTSMPIYLFLCMIGCLLANGGAVISAHHAGNDQMDKAGEIFKSALSLGFISGAFVTALGVLFSKLIALFLAQNGSLTDYVFQYSLVTWIGTLATILIYFPLGYLQIVGQRKDISVTVAIMILTDAALDWLLMFVFDFGMYGASAASVISTGLACVYGFYRLGRGEKTYSFKLIRPDSKLFKPIFESGSPSALGNLYDSVKLFFLNSIILYSGGAEAAAIWAVLNTLSELSLIIISGVPVTATPMIGVFFSARENGSIRILNKIQNITGINLSLAYTVMLLILIVPMENYFGVTHLLFPVICLGVSVALTVMCRIWISHFNVTDRLLVSNVLMMSLKLIAPVAIAMLLSSLHLNIWLFLPLGAGGTLLVGWVLTGIIANRSNQTEKPLSRFLLLDDTLEREHKVLDFTIAADMNDVCKASENIQDFCNENGMDLKLTTRIGLGIEELLGVLVQKLPDTKNYDLRVYAINGTAGIRIRCAGKRYDPFQDEDEDEDLMMGINMMKKLAEIVKHSYTLGLNTINIIFEYEGDQ